VGANIGRWRIAYFWRMEEPLKKRSLRFYSSFEEQAEDQARMAYDSLNMVNILHAAHQEILHQLLEHGVDFILIGGYAVIAHGYERTTGFLPGRSTAEG